MSGEPDESLRVYESLSNTERDSKTISRAGPSSQLINDGEAVLADVSSMHQHVTTDQLHLAHLKIKAVSLISLAKVDTFASIQSSMLTLANNWSTSGKDAYCAGTKLPI